MLSDERTTIKTHDKDVCRLHYSTDIFVLKSPNLITTAQMKILSFKKREKAISHDNETVIYQICTHAPETEKNVMICDKKKKLFGKTLCYFRNFVINCAYMYEDKV